MELACTSAATGLHYWLYLPEHPSGEKLPMILYLHGFSHSGSDLGKLLRGGPPQEIEAGRAINAVVVSPQCPSGDIWPSAKMVEQLSEFVDELLDLYPVDPQRVTLTGFSMGGDGTWWLGVAHPELFAALAPVASWYLKTGEMCALKDMPIWDFQGEKDTIVNPEIARDRADALETYGGSVKLTFYPDADHEQSSRLAYGTDALYEWLLSKKK
jgi:predicted peptidase